MLALTIEQQEALSKRHVMQRHFVWVDALDLDGSTPAPAGFWNDVYNVEIGGRTYYGSGTLIQVGSLALVEDFSILGLSITVSGIAPAVANTIRGAMVAQRAVEFHIGIYDVDAHELIGSLIPRFIGKVDDIEITTPAAGGQSVIVLTCESVSRGLTIVRFDTRSTASQAARAPADKFYDYTAVQREKPIYFGKVDQKRTQAIARRKAK